MLRKFFCRAMQLEYLDVQSSIREMVNLSQKDIRPFADESLSKLPPSGVEMDRLIEIGRGAKSQTTDKRKRSSKARDKQNIKAVRAAKVLGC